MLLIVMLFGRIGMAISYSTAFVVVPTCPPRQRL
jgi:hypothetical protein